MNDERQLRRKISRDGGQTPLRAAPLRAHCPRIRPDESPDELRAGSALAYRCRAAPGPGKWRSRAGPGRRYGGPLHRGYSPRWTGSAHDRYGHHDGNDGGWTGQGHPPGRILGPLFHFFFYRLAPLFGTIIGKAFEEYNYLPQSLTNFPGAPALKALMEEAGWSDVRFYRLTGGIVAVHVGTKPE